MTILTRFLIFRFMRTLIFALLAAVLVFLVIDLIENMDKFLDSKAATKYIVEYYYLYVPYIAYLVFPVAMILATLTTIGGLINTHELAAMRASGVSLWWISTRLWIMSIVIACGLFWFGEYLMPGLNQQRMEIWRVEVKKLPRKSTVRSDRIYLLEGQGRFFHMEQWNEITHNGYRPTLQIGKGIGLSERTDADRAHWDSSTGWVFYNGYSRTWANGVETTEPFKEKKMSGISLTPVAFTDLSVRPEEMGYNDLKRFIDKLEITGSDTTRWLVELWSKLAMAASAIVIVLLGVPIAAVQRRSGVIFSFGIGLFVSFLFYGIIQIAKIYGYSGELSPFVSAWIADFLFTIIGIVMLVRVRK